MPTNNACITLWVIAITTAILVWVRQSKTLHILGCFRKINLPFTQSPTNTLGRKCLFNDALNTFCLQLYGIGHMEKTTRTVKEETWCHYMG